MSKVENPVIHVLDRMVEVALGESAHFKSHADALGVPFETVKSWKRRRKVPLYELEMFSERYGVTIDWLLHGDQPEAAQAEAHQVNQHVQPYGLSDAEASLLESYRRSSPEVQAAALRVLAGEPPEPRPTIPRPARIVERVSDLPAKKFTPPRKRKSDTG